MKQISKSNRADRSLPDLISKNLKINQLFVFQMQCNSVLRVPDGLHEAPLKDEAVSGLDVVA